MTSSIRLPVSTNAVAMMCAGMPVANLLGVPVGTFLSHMFSWRVPFVSCIVLGLITLYMIHRWVPDVEALPNNGMKAQFHFLRNKAPWLIIAATFLGNMYYRGQGVKKNKEKAVYWLEKSAIRGDVDAQELLYRIHHAKPGEFDD